MLLEEKIQQVKLTELEETIIQFLFDHKYELSKLSTRKIAASCYCSSGAIIRLSHKLGYSGYDELKKDYLAEIKYLESHFQDIDANIPFTAKHSMMEIAGIMENLMIESTKDTASLFEHDTLQKAMQAINKAHIIYIFAISSHILYAKIFQMKMTRLGKVVIVQEVQGEILHQVLSVSSQDLAILISYSGETKSLIKVAKQLERNHIKMMSITSIGDNTLKTYASIHLHLSTREKLISKIANFTSEYALELILNTLYSLYFSMNYQKNLSYKIEETKRLENERSSTHEMIKE